MTNHHHLLLAFIAVIVPAVNAQTVTGSGLTALERLSTAAAINNAGQIAGSGLGHDFWTHAFLYSGGAATEIPTLSGRTGYATGINNLGQVIGYSDTIPNTYSGQPQAFVYSGGTTSNIGGVLGGSTSWAYGINDAGQIVGAVYNTAACAFCMRTFLYSGGTMSDLGTFGGNNAIASAINNVGQIAGQAEDSAGTYKLFIDSGGVMSDLGLNANTTGRAVWDMNDAGQIAGVFSDGSHSHAFLYSGGTMTDLGNLLGGPNANAYGINAAGWVVGGSHQRAYVYLGGTMFDLNTVFASSLVVNDGVQIGFTNLDQANDINDVGQIVGEGTWSVGDGSYTHKAFVLTVIASVPEPSSYALMAGGLVLLRSAIRRRKHAGA